MPRYLNIAASFFGQEVYYIRTNGDSDTPETDFGAPESDSVVAEGDFDSRDGSSDSGEVNSCTPDGDFCMSEEGFDTRDGDSDRRDRDFCIGNGRLRVAVGDFCEWEADFALPASCNSNSI